MHQNEDTHSRGTTRIVMQANHKANARELEKTHSAECGANQFTDIELFWSVNWSVDYNNNYFVQCLMCIERCVWWVHRVSLCDVQCAFWRSRDHSCALPDTQIHIFYSFNLAFHFNYSRPHLSTRMHCSVNQSRFVSFIFIASLCFIVWTITFNQVMI